MKRLFFLGALFLGALSVVAQTAENPQLPTDPNVRVGKLDNGLTYYIRHNELPKQRAEFHIAQAVGAILEEDHQNGLAHFLEHMAFNGTEHFHGKGIIKYFESIGVNFGGNINAYTSLDETVYRLSDVPTIREGIIDSALLVMHDWSHSLLLEGDEIDAERGVILEEWRTGASAERRMWKELNPKTYPGSQYAKRDVIGDTAVILHFDYQALRDYYHKWYGPDLQAIIVVGDIDVDQIEQKIRKLWADVPARPNRGERPIYTINDNQEPIVAVVKDKEAQYTRVRIDFKQNQLPEQMQNTVASYSLDVMQNLITSMFNTRLEELTQKHDAPFVGAGCTYTEIVKKKDAFIAIAVAKEEQERNTLSALIRELEKVRRFGFNNSELELAKAQLLSAYESSYNERQATRNISFTREYIRNFLDGEPIPGIEWEYEFVKQVLPFLSVEQLNQMVAAYLHDDNVIVSITAPDKGKVALPDEQEVRHMLADAKNLELEAPAEEVLDKNLVKKAPKKGKIKKTTVNSELGTTEWLLKNGVRVILKPTDFKQDEILMRAYSFGGISTETDLSRLPSDEMAEAVIEYAGLGDFSLVQLQKALAGKNVSVSPSVNTYSEQISGSSSIRDFETMLQLTYLYFTAPRKDEESFKTLMGMLETNFKNKESNHKAIFRDSVALMTSGHSPRTLVWNTDLIGSVDVDKAYSFFRQRFADAADFTFVFVGNIDPENPQTVQLITQWLGGLKTGKAKREKENFRDDGVRVPKGIQRNYFDRKMQIHTATNRIQYTSYDIPYTLDNDLNMEMIGRILSTRYLESIREREGGSYGVGCAGYCSRLPVSEAVLIMQFDTDPQKQDRLLQIIHEEVKTILDNGPLAEDLQKEKESMLKDFQEDLDKNNYWCSTILPEYYRYGIDYVKDYEAAVRRITSETVRQTLQKLVESGNMFEVVMLPAE